MEWVGMFLVFIASSGIGLLYSSMYNKRVDDLIEFKKSLVLMRNEIKFSRTPLIEAFESVARKLKSNVSEFYIAIIELLKQNVNQTMEQLDDLSIKKLLANTYFNEKDKLSIIHFIKSLGLMDKETQLNHINLQIEELKVTIDQAQNDAKKNSKLYRTLGVLVGIMVIVIFI